MDILDNIIVLYEKELKEKIMIMGFGMVLKGNVKY